VRAQAGKEVFGQFAVAAIAVRACRAGGGLAGHFDAFAVGRVEHQRAGQIVRQRGGSPLEGVTAVEDDGRFDAGALRVAARKVDHAKRHIAREDRHSRGVDAGLRVAAQTLQRAAHFGA